MLSRRILLIGVGMAAVLLAAPSESFGVTVDPNPIVLTGSGFTVVITQIGTATGVPAGGVSTCCSSTPIGSSPSIVLQATNAGSVTVDLLRFLPLVTAGGWLPGATEPDGLVDVVVGTCGPSIQCAAFTGGLAPGATSNAFYLFPGAFGASHVAAINLGLSLISDEVQVAFVPEPGSGVILGAGLAFLGARSRRNRAVSYARRASAAQSD